MRENSSRYSTQRVGLSSNIETFSDKISVRRSSDGPVAWEWISLHSFMTE